MWLHCPSSFCSVQYTCGQKHRHQQPLNQLKRSTQQSQDTHRVCTASDTPPQGRSPWKGNNEGGELQRQQQQSQRAHTFLTPALPQTFALRACSPFCPPTDRNGEERWILNTRTVAVQNFEWVLRSKAPHHRHTLQPQTVPQTGGRWAGRMATEKHEIHSADLQRRRSERPYPRRIGRCTPAGRSASAGIPRGLCTAKDEAAANIPWGTAQARGNVLRRAIWVIIMEQRKLHPL